MRERLEQRLNELRKEFQEGQRTIVELESKLTTVRSTVLRISGAIQVLEEELALSAADRGPPNRRDLIRARTASRPRMHVKRKCMHDSCDTLTR